METTGERFERAVTIMSRLRAPGGCPWDREQTFDSIKPYTVEETYEVLEAIDNRDWQELPGELGDLLLQVLFYSQMASEDEKFSIDDVLDRLSSKLIRRHPHVFGEVRADTSAEVLRNWEQIKAEEKQDRFSKDDIHTSSTDVGNKDPKSILEDVSVAMPALLEAKKLSSRAAQVGFDWPHIDALFEKLKEETEELQNELRTGLGRNLPDDRDDRNQAEATSQPVDENARARLENELGDMFFVLVNIARYLSLDPESSLKRSNRKFRQRFQWMEEQLRASGRAPSQAAMDELEELWRQAKQQEPIPR
ncbi:MAG: nucleoside triphosphate pyrophosphohydrolase [Acidobacteriaceae bacterium]